MIIFTVIRTKHVLNGCIFWKFKMHQLRGENIFYAWGICYKYTNWKVWRSIDYGVLDFLIGKVNYGYEWQTQYPIGVK